MIYNTIRAVFFDAVGTLLFPRVPVSQTYAEFARRHGGHFGESDIQPLFRNAFARQERRDSQDNWRTDEARERSRWQTIVAEVLPIENSDACFAELWQYYSMPAAWSVNAEAGEVLVALADCGLTLGAASNFDGRLAGLLAAIPALAPLRERCVISAAVGFRKPAREFFAAVINAAGCDAQKILIVGDDLRNDIHGATAAGLRAVLFDPEGRTESMSRIRQLRDLLPVSGVSQ
jgi:putative hydrolase of the HAD superfamily